MEPQKLSKRNILVVYAGKTAPLRSSLNDHLYSFQRFANQNCYYLNASLRGLPWYFKSIRFDLIVFHTLFLSMRGSRRAFVPLLEKLRELKTWDAVKVAIPQDEFIHSAQLCEFINEFGVNYVFSTAASSEWPKIYDKVDLEKVRVSTVLTGYLSASTIERIGRIASKAGPRDIDVGYRTQRQGPSTGRHGQLKSGLADVFQEKGRRSGLTTDISTRNKDIFLGDSWYSFLLRCKYTIGVEGGTSVLDRTGEIKRKVQAYVSEHPDADFAEVEAACFPNDDGNLSLFAISPRHLEACATRTCQVLVEGDYNGILRAAEHYIELKRDFSNIDAVLDVISRDDQREAITERAHRDIVESGRYSYEAFVRSVIDGPLEGVEERRLRPRLAGAWEWWVYRWARIADRLSWMVAALLSAPRNVLRRLLSEEGFRTLSGWKRRLIRR